MFGIARTGEAGGQQFEGGDSAGYHGHVEVPDLRRAAGLLFAAIFWYPDFIRTAGLLSVRATHISERLQV